MRVNAAPSPAMTATSVQFGRKMTDAEFEALRPKIEAKIGDAGQVHPDWRTVTDWSKPFSLVRFFTDSLPDCFKILKASFTQAWKAANDQPIPFGVDHCTYKSPEIADTYETVKAEKARKSGLEAFTERLSPTELLVIARVNPEILRKEKPSKEG